MDESVVFDRVIDEVENRGYEPLVHVPSAHETRFRSVLERCPSHQISIQGRYPDVVGFTETNRVFTIEVKGDSAVLKGIGQALTYQQGSHYSYLAADAGALEEVTDLAVSKGLGTIECAADGAVRWETPNQALSRDLLPDVEGQLSYRLHRRESAGQIAAMDLAQPLNFLAPALAVAALDDPTKEAVADQLEDEYDFSATRGAIDGAEVLGIVESMGSDLRLTEQGELVRVVLAGSGVRSLSDLQKTKESIPRGQTVSEQYPPLATLLRNLMLRHPELRLFVEALAELRRELVTVPEIIELLVRQYPNVFLNLLCTTSGREEARSYIERGRMDEIYRRDEVWRDVLRTNVLFNFVHQLRHVGILSPETTGHGRALSEYDPDEKPWILEKVEL